jgi:tetratricopeptide (TPR) repeat protein
MNKKYVIILIFIAVNLFAENLEDYKLQFENVKNSVEYLSKDYLDDNALKSDYKLSKRFNDGYVTYLLEDYPIATMIFYDIVSRKQYKNDPVYIESLFYLAESFRHLKNYLGAREYYQQVLEYHDKKFNQMALRYFLELSRKVGDFRGTDKYMNELESSRELIDDSVYYEKGKALFNQKRYDKAIADFLKIKKESSFRMKALYYAAVCYTAKAKNIEYQFSETRDNAVFKDRELLILNSKLLDQEASLEESKKIFENSELNYKEVRRKYIQYNKWYYSLKRVNKKLRDQKAEFDEKHKVAKDDLANRKKLYEKELASYNSLKEEYTNMKNDIKSLSSKRDELKEPYKERVKIYEKAIELFRKVSILKPMEQDDKLIIDQAILSMGRIYYTINNLQEAINAYQDIDRNSKFYDISLYESAWTYVKAKEPKKALYAVDLLIDVLPDSVVVPDALLLRANLYNEMSEFEKASEAYGYIEDRYSLVSEELQKIIDDNDDLEAYFSNILSSDINSFSASKFLPKEALKYVRSEKLVKKAQNIVREINETKRYLKESLEILNKLLAMLSDKTSINALFPKTDEVREKLLENTNKLLEIDYNLNNYFYTFYKDKTNKELKLLRFNILRIWESFNNTPVSKSQYEKRKIALNDEYLRLTKRSYKANMYIGNLEKEIKAMEMLFSENIRKYRYSKEKQNLFYENISQKKQNLLVLKDKVKKISEKIDAWKVSINSVDKAHVADKKIREKLYLLLLKERGFYTNIAKYNEAKVLIKKINTYKEKISKLSNSLDSIIVKKAVIIKEDILKEKESLEEYKLAIDEKVAVSKKLSTVIALTSFRTVNKKFYDLILNADLGELEVIWKGKDKLSKDIQSYYSQERDRLKILDNEFKEILGENK